ncbi:hypothetical protein WMF38_29760 [Sorangium sp. So ce118]
MGRDNPSQTSVITMEIGGSPGDPTVAINGETFTLGADLTDRFGFDDCRLDHRLLRVLTYLAVRRSAGGAGWVDADELGFFADCGATGGSAAKLLERRLREVPGDASCDQGRLIEYGARENVSGRGGGRFGGRSRGPYRLGVPAPRLHLDPQVCWAILLDRPIIAPAPCGDLDETLAAARGHAAAGRFHDARREALSALGAIYRGEVAQTMKGRDRALLVGDSWALLSTIDMEMGRWSEGLLASRRAKVLFTGARSPERVAHAWELEAHLLGQREDGDFRLDAVAAARNALHHLESASREWRSGLRRAYHVGVLGRRLSHAGDTRRGAKGLTWAFRAAHEAGSAHWAAIWACRLAENDVRSGDIASAERNLAIATDLTCEPTAAADALLLRVRAEVLLASQRWSEAAPWIERAMQAGSQRDMRHQLRLARELLAAMNERRSRPR